MNSPGARAWLVVALLWLVACLNYIDRIMLTTMRASVVDAIPMSDAQFGLLTSAFLWVYGLCSPVGGFLADRFKRSHVIIGSLFVWSVVTWVTSRCTTFEGLLLTRALMGISEACYVPAALALISDYHRGPTLSFATALHMTGMMIGSSLGGLGGWIAERNSWSFAFSFFGAFGVGYAILLLFLLREAPVHREGPAPAPVNFVAAVKSLFGTFSFVLAFVYWGALGVLWSIIGWLPTYLTEKFHLGQGVAGLSATGYLQAAAMVGVLFGGFWADAWSRRNPRARIYVPVAGLLISTPALLVVANGELLPLVIGALIVHGFTRAFTDATMMPILCLITDARYRATGYGLLNLCACFVGGLAIYAGGLMRDRGIDLPRLFQFAAVCLGLCTLLLLGMRTAPRTAR
jgi:MFS family permease